MTWIMPSASLQDPFVVYEIEVENINGMRELPDTRLCILVLVEEGIVDELELVSSLDDLCDGKPGGRHRISWVWSLDSCWLGESSRGRG